MKLGDRMKEYEYTTRNYLPRRVPIIIRIDGKAFHTFTKGFIKPYDKLLSEAMADTTKYLVENIQGCVLGYTQSDEISLLLLNSQTLETEAWMKNNLSKMLSISASMATLAFNRSFEAGVRKVSDAWESHKNHLKSIYTDKLDNEVITNWNKSTNKGALFDSRAFILPNMDEVVNYFIWRQEDASKNSVQMLAQTLYSQKQLQGLHTGEMQNKMFEEKSINWNNIEVRFKRGLACYRKEVPMVSNNGVRKKVIIDTEIPIFKENRDFIFKLEESEI